MFTSLVDDMGKRYPISQTLQTLIRKQRSHGSLASVLHASSYTLHCQNKGILETRSILAFRVEFYQLCCWIARFHVILGQMWPQLHMVVRLTDSLQSVGLQDIESCDV